MNNYEKYRELAALFTEAAMSGRTVEAKHPLADNWLPVERLELKLKPKDESLYIGDGIFAEDCKLGGIYLKAAKGTESNPLYLSGGTVSNLLKFLYRKD